MNNIKQIALSLFEQDKNHEETLHARVQSYYASYRKAKRVEQRLIEAYHKLFQGWLVENNIPDPFKK
jgi:hypothetical protein